MTMTIEKIEFPRRETKQSKSKKSLTIDSEDEPVESIGEPDPVIKQLETDKSLDSLAPTPTKNNNVLNDHLKASDEKPTAATTAVINKTSSSIQGDFGKYLLEDGKSRATIESYMGDIRKYLEWLENKQGTFEGQLSRVSITSYRNQLEQEDYAVNTINKKINSLNSFNHYLIREGFCEKLVVFPNKDKIKIANGSEKEVAVFSDDEVEQLLFFLEKKDLVSLRDKTILLTLLYTGLRVSEVVGLKIQDIDRLTMNLKVVGKGGKYRELPIKPELAETIKSYLETERKDSPFASSDYLFVTQRAKKMDTDTVNKLLNKHGKSLGMILYPHKFRHTFCTRLLKKGVDLTTVAKLAGHANIQTTASFYINTSREDKQEAVGLL